MPFWAEFYYEVVFQKPCPLIARKLIVDNANNNTITGLSGMEINSDSGTTVLTLPIKIFDIVDRPDNQLASVDTSLPNARWTVMHNHTIFAPAGRVGI